MRNRPFFLAALALTGFLPLPPVELLAAEIPLALEIARGGGARAGGRSFSGSGARTGFASFSGGGGRGGARVETRQSNRSSRVDTRQVNRTSRTDGRQSNRSDRLSDRTDTRRDAINTWDRNRPAWVNSSWATSRPWRYGWYAGSPWNTWTWWPGRAAAGGIGTMASFAVFDSLVDSAVNSQTSYVLVPESDYALYYSSVQVSGELVTFQASDGSTTLTFRADCRAGTLNGYPRQNASEAQLLNAACLVAFGE